MRELRLFGLRQRRLNCFWPLSVLNLNGTEPQSIVHIVTYFVRLMRTLPSATVSKELLQAQYNANPSFPPLVAVNDHSLQYHVSQSTESPRQAISLDRGSSSLLKQCPLSNVADSLPFLASLSSAGGAGTLPAHSPLPPSTCYYHAILSCPSGHHLTLAPAAGGLVFVPLRHVAFFRCLLLVAFSFCCDGFPIYGIALACFLVPHPESGVLP